MKKVATAGAIALVTLLLFEAALQVLAFGASLTRRGADAPDAAGVGTRTVVCLGDSFTYGVGASRPTETSYPAKLGESLGHRDDGPWEVINAGWPGRDSRGVIEVLDYQLLTSEPEFLILLIGINDTWHHPERLELPPLDEARAQLAESGAPAQGGGGFRWELRTRRLLQTLRGQDLFRDEAGAAAGEQPSPSEAGADPAGEILHCDGRLTRPFPKDPAVSVYPWDPLPEDPAAREEVEAAHKALGSAWTALDESRFDDAAAAARSLPASFAAARADILARVFGNTGRLDEANRQLEAAIALIGDSELTLKNAEHIASVIHNTNASEETIPHLEALAKRFPDGIVIHQTLASSLLLAGDTTRTGEVVDHLWKLQAERGNEHYSAAAFYKFAAGVLLPRDPVGAAEALCLRYALNGMAPEFDQNIRNLRKTGHEITAAHFAEAAARLPLSEGALAELTATVDHAFAANLAEAASPEEALATLAFHYGEVQRRCDELGIRLLLINYPFFNQKITALHGPVAERGEGARALDATLALDARIRESGQPREAFFASDGHCNDAGYALFAEVVGETLAAWIAEAETPEP